MEQIESVEQMINALRNPEDEHFFEKFAPLLINKFCIRKHDNRNDNELLYRVVELESYYYDSAYVNEEVNTINRDCKAGEWFFHQYGVDLAYETIKDGDELLKFGGILIRSVERYKFSDDKWVFEGVIGGPVLVMQEVFNHTNIMPHWEELPTSIESLNYTSGKRIMGKSNDDKPDSKKRFLADNIKWDAPFRQIVEDKKTYEVKYETVCKKYDYKSMI